MIVAVVGAAVWKIRRNAKEQDSVQQIMAAQADRPTPVQVSAVQNETDSSGKTRPRKDSTMINVDSPLRYCLRAIEMVERRQETERTKTEATPANAPKH